ncbi:MAG: hypothetical protein IPL35_03885 [Sphingobacteriales bacterium]|nr:hypothetical protein [Sphingobacteriales bacterium]
MELFIDILKITIPAVLVLLAAVVVLRQEAEKSFRLQHIRQQGERNKQTLPLRLQAYERLVLLMERLEPAALIQRVRDEEMTIPELQYALITSIRGEMEHNLSQQIYVGDSTWLIIKSGVEELISTINGIAAEMPAAAANADYARAILQHFVQQSKISPTQLAIHHLKREAADLLG